MLHGSRISPAGLVQQVLQRPTVLQRAPDLGFQFVRNIDGNATPLDAAIQHVAGVLVAAITRGAVRAHAGALSQTQGPERSGPQSGSLGSEPALNLGGRFDLTWHGDVYVPYRTYTCQEKLLSSNSAMSWTFRDRNELDTINVLRRHLTPRLRPLLPVNAIAPASVYTGRLLGSNVAT